MRNLLALFALGLLGFAAVGWYLDWYKVKSAAEPEGHHNINIDLNKDKIREDVNRGVRKSEEKLQEFLDQKAREKKDPPADAKPAAQGPRLFEE